MFFRDSKVKLNLDTAVLPHHFMCKKRTEKVNFFLDKLGERGYNYTQVTERGYFLARLLSTWKLGERAGNRTFVIFGRRDLV